MDELLQHATQLANQTSHALITPIKGRVAYVVSHGQSYASNGYAIRTQGVAKALNQYGFETLCFVRPGRPWELKQNTQCTQPEVVIQGVRYIHSRWPSDAAPTNDREHLEASVQQFMTLFSVYRPESVLAASNWVVGLPAWVAAKRLGLPFYNEVRGFWELSRAAQDPAFEGSKTCQIEAERDTFVAKQGRTTFTLNAPMQEELVKRGIRRENIQLVPNGVSELPNIAPADPALKKQLGIKEDEKVVGYIGSHSVYEGLDTLVEACEALVQQGQKIKLLLVGDHQPLTAAKKANKSYGKQPWLIQTGRVPHDKVSNYYALIDLVVIPRRKLPVCELVPPMKVAEALAYGKRLVVSDVPALEEYAVKYDGVVTFEAGKTEFLVQAIQVALKMPLPKTGPDFLMSTRTDLMEKVLRGDGVESDTSISYLSSEIIFENLTSIDIAKKFYKVNKFKNHTKHFIRLNDGLSEKELISLSSNDFRMELNSWIEDSEDIKINLICWQNDIEKVGKSAGIAKLKFYNSEGDEVKDLELTNLSWSNDLKCWYFYFKSEQLNKGLESSFIFIKPVGIYKIEITFTKWHDDTVEIRNLIEITRQPSILSILRNEFSDIISELKKPPIKNNTHKLSNKLCYVLNHSLPYQSEGYATRSQGLAKAIANQGLNVVCLSRPGFPWSFIKELKEKDLPTIDTIDGVEYHRIREPSGWKGTQHYIAKAANELEKKFIEINPSCVMAASDFKNGMPALLAARRLGIPFIYEIRGFWEVTHQSREPSIVRTSQYQLTRYLETLLAFQADHLFTLTLAMKKELTSRGIPANRVSLLPNSCDPNLFEPATIGKDEKLLKELEIPFNVPVIGYIGTFNSYEGLDDLMYACGELFRQGIIFRVLLVGSEPPSNAGKESCATEIESIAKNYGFYNWLIMLGRIPHKMVSKYYALIDIAPFTRKPLPVTELVSPLKPLEAMAMEKALVVSSVGALAEMVKEGETGLIYQKGNVQELAEKLKLLISDSTLRKNIGMNARRWVINNRTWKICAESVKEKVDYFENNLPVATLSPKKKLASKLASQYKVAFIADEFSYNSFKDEFEAIVIEPDNWKTKFKECQPDIFFCESAWSGVDAKRRPWQGKIYTSTNWKKENRTVLLSILEHCRQEGIPTVFWNKEDPTHFTDRIHDFIATAKEFDFVFTTAEECCDIYKEKYGVKNVFPLPFATNPKLFNPIETSPRNNKVVFAGSWYSNHEERSAAMKQIMDTLLAAGYELEIYDRYYGSADSLHEWPERYKKFIHPGQSHDKMPDIYRSSKFGLNFNTVTESPTMFARRVFELMSSHTLVISNYSHGVEKMFGDLVVFADKDPARLNALTDFDVNKIRDKALRLVLEEHTYTNRWQEILTKIGIPWREENTGITFVCRIFSDKDASKAINYHQKNYSKEVENKLLLLIDEDVEPLIVAKMYQKYNRANVSVTSLHHIKVYALKDRYNPIETKYFIYASISNLPEDGWIREARIHLSYVYDRCLTPQKNNRFLNVKVDENHVLLGRSSVFYTTVTQLMSGTTKAYTV